MRIRRLLFYVCVSLFAMLLLWFVILNGNYMQMFNDKFMTLSLASTGTNTKSLVSDDDTDVSNDNSNVSNDNSNVSNEIVSSTSEVDTSNTASTDISTDTTISSDTASKYLDISVYDISWGDTLSGISRLTGVSVDELVKLNNISNPNLIYSGSSIKIR